MQEEEGGAGCGVKLLSPGSPLVLTHIDCCHVPFSLAHHFILNLPYHHPPPPKRLP